jgi:acetyl-CoA C-acetyltransferase
MASEVLNALVDRTGIDPAAIEDVVLGCVSQVGEQSFHNGQNAVLASKLPNRVPAVSINRQCGSSQQAVMFAAQAVMPGTQDVVVAAGVESMTRVAMGTPTVLAAQAGLGVGPWSECIKSRYGVTECSQFTGAQLIADKYNFSREQLDAFALKSHRRAAAATLSGAFEKEIIKLALIGGLHTKDEGIRDNATIESIGAVMLLKVGRQNFGRQCKPGFWRRIRRAGGQRAALRTHRLTPLARLVNMTVTAGDPVLMLEEPLPATQRALKRAGMSINDIDLYEVNEAFAPIPLAWLQVIDADPANLNVNGGAIALGHPLGASGAKLMATLIYALKAEKPFGCFCLISAPAAKAFSVPVSTRQCCEASESRQQKQRSDPPIPACSARSTSAAGSTGAR